MTTAAAAAAAAVAVNEPDAQRAYKLSSAKKKVSCAPLSPIWHDRRLRRTDTCLTPAAQTVPRVKINTTVGFLERLFVPVFVTDQERRPSALLHAASHAECRSATRADGRNHRGGQLGALPPRRDRGHLQLRTVHLAFETQPSWEPRHVVPQTSELVFLLATTICDAECRRTRSRPSECHGIV